GYTFDGWDRTFDNVTSDMTVTAIWRKNSSGGGSSGGGSSSGDGTGDSSETPVNPAPVTQINSGDSTTDSNLQQLVSEGETLTVVKDEGAKLEFDTDALKGIISQATGEITVEIKDVSIEHQENLPGKTVFSLTVNSGSSIISNFGGKVTVSLPYELREGERAEDVTVWHIADDGTMTEISCTYDPVTKLATFTVNHFSLYVVGVAGSDSETDTEPWVNPFKDVKESDWFYEAVKFAKQKGLFAGTGEDTFSPSMSMTRAMFWTVLSRLDGQKFTGRNEFEAARIWAMETGITDGATPENTITREQMISILWRYAGSPKVSGDLSEFSDSGNVAGYAVDAMVWAVENGIIVGSNGALIPKENANRAQTAAILQRFVEKVKK
ncbi:MAG: S-layer homology domain-containing protein, partial [Acetivibrionales bacterium]